MEAPKRHLHFSTQNRPEGRVQLSWDGHTVDELTEREAQRVVLDVALDQFQPEMWGDRHAGPGIVRH